MNYAGNFLTAFNPASPARNLYRVIDNLTNVPQKRYRGTPDNVEHFNYPGTTITVGINGRF